MSTPARILLALSEKNMTAYEIADALDLRMVTARGALTELIDRVLVVATTRRIKSYGLTTLGQMEADRLQALGDEARTKTPTESAPVVDISEVIAKQHPLASVWSAANV